MLQVIVFKGGQGRNRTTDTRIFSPLLYRLSYLAITKSCTCPPWRDCVSLLTPARPFFALAVLLRSKDRGVPSVARPFTGQRVHWTLCNAPVHPCPSVRPENPYATRSRLRYGTGPSPPWLGRSAGQRSAGPLPSTASPTGFFYFGLTRPSYLTITAKRAL